MTEIETERQRRGGGEVAYERKLHVKEKDRKGSCE